MNDLTVIFIKLIKLHIMQELSRSLEQRINKTKQAIENQISTQLKTLRQQEKIRCEKQNFIISMIRSNKIMSTNLKATYYSQSFKLMKLIQPKFQFQVKEKVQEDFLNNFIHLYSAFFAHFQNKFSFKTKIKNFLRPTNHNLVVDLIKYFVDFTRDYYVQTLFWKMKTILRNDNKSRNDNLKLFEDQQILGINQSQANLIISQQGKLPTPIYRNIGSSLTDSLSDNLLASPKKKTDEAEQKRNHLVNYQILEATMPNLTLNLAKEGYINIEGLKMKVNQLFRQQKHRNSSNKQIYQNYIDEYQLKFQQQPTSGFLNYRSSTKNYDDFASRCYPYRFYIYGQKNNFSVIQIQVDPKRSKNSSINTANNCKFSSNPISTSTNKLNTNSNSSSAYNSPDKFSYSNTSPLRFSQREPQCGDQSIKSDYFLTSMKVLRVSENFLPPLIASSNNINALNTKKQFQQNKIKYQENRYSLPFSFKLQKMTDQVEDAVPFMTEQSNSSNVLVKSISYKKTYQQKKHALNYKSNGYHSDPFRARVSQQKRKRKQSQDQSTYKMSNKKFSVKKKSLGEDRKNIQTGNYFPTYYKPKQYTQSNQQSQQKILQWLQKIKNLKQIQRRKILGVNI